ncbi:hypothetical protein JCM10212_005246 [Sporobolomyces blumeae]
MFGLGSRSTPAPAQEPTATRLEAPVAARRTLEQLVEEELPIQRHSVDMMGGMPSCLTLFDEFFLCYSLASQAKSVYRHGVPRDCSNKFDDFKFCLSLKSLDKAKRDEVWVRRRAEWWAQRRIGRSSEDVWDARPNVYTDPKRNPPTRP